MQIAYVDAVIASSRGSTKVTASRPFFREAYVGM
jgi:hypothetical protein